MKLLALNVMLLASLAPMAQAQAGAPKSAPKQSLILRGKVTGLNEAGKVMTVDHETVVGFMDAMTMPYKVDKAEVFKSVKVGDQIQATVYAGDYTLYEVKVVPPKAKK